MDNQLILDRLDTVRNSLVQAFNDPLISTQGLCQTISRLVTWMEEQFGRIVSILM